MVLIWRIDVILLQVPTTEKCGEKRGEKGKYKRRNSEGKGTRGRKDKKSREIVNGKEREKRVKGRRQGGRNGIQEESRGRLE